MSALRGLAERMWLSAREVISAPRLFAKTARRALGMQASLNSFPTVTPPMTTDS